MRRLGTEPDDLRIGQTRAEPSPARVPILLPPTALDCGRGIVAHGPDGHRLRIHALTGDAEHPPLPGAARAGTPNTMLASRTAVITGAAGGIGAAIAHLFASHGASVACLDLAPPSALAAAIEAAGGRALAVAADVTDPASVDAAIQRVQDALGPVTILINGAAALDPTATIIDLHPDDWRRTLDVTLTGAYLVSRAVLPGMIAAGGGSIVHVASQMGHVGAPGRAAYCAAKGALIQLAKVMALDHAADGVRVNSLSPGAIETGRLTHRFGSMDQARAAAVPRHPIGRLGQPEEIAEAALFLVSDRSRFMTGSDLLIDGGYTAA